MSTNTEKRVTHIIRVPPLTDIPELLGNYANLFSTMGIGLTNFPFQAMEGFQHPIPESQEILLHDYMDTMRLCQSLVYDHASIILENARAVGPSVTFVFKVAG